MFPWLVDISVDWINADQSELEIRVERKTAPGPILGMSDQFSFQWIHVHVMEFFDFLLQTPHVEIIEAPLPKAWQRIGVAFKGQFQLCGRRSLFAAH